MSEISRSKAGPAYRVRLNFRRLVIAIGLICLASPVQSAGAITSVVDPNNGLEIIYTQGSLRITNLAPGLTGVGFVEVTNTLEGDLIVHLSADWVTPPLVEAGVVLAAEMCAERWREAQCSRGARPIELTSGTTHIGMLRGGESWHLMLSATMDPESGNETQRLKEEFSLRLLAQVDESMSPSEEAPELPTESDLPGTGWAGGSLVAFAALLVASGSIAAVFARRASASSDSLHRHVLCAPHRPSSDDAIDRGVGEWS